MNLDQMLRLRIVLRETNIGEFYDYAQSSSDPKGSGYGQHLARSARTGPDADLKSRYQKVAAIFHGAARVVPVRDSAIDAPYSPLLFVDGTEAYFDPFFEGKTLARFLDDVSGGSQVNPWEWDGELALLESEIRSIHLARCGQPPEEDTRTPRSIRAPSPPVRGGFVSDPNSGNGSADGRFDIAQEPRLEDGVTPQMIRDYYDFPKDCSGQGQTIALMSIGTAESRTQLLDDLQTFWAAVGAGQPSIEFVEVGPPHGEVESSPLNRLEASMGAAWIGALVPAAKIVVYELAPDLPDPWSAAVEMAVSDPRAPNILCMTWTLPEDTYYRQFNRGSIALALAKAAAFGITVIAGAGDWGVYDGRPGSVLEDDEGAGKVARAAWPHATFPSSEDLVLSVGGTLVASLDPPTEIGWSGPLPPDPALAKELPFLSLSTSGGFSERVPIPAWQRPVVVGLSAQRSYSRGTNLPAVLPYGRGFPDVALMASGPPLSLGNGAGLSAMGYRLVIDGKWIGYAGGTSMAAPIWAAVIAIANSRRQENGQPPLGFANPLLYYLGRTSPDTGKHAVLRDITSGNSDIEFRVVSGQGRSDHHTLAGYRAKSQWDPITGLGVPHVTNLTNAVLAYPANFRGKPASSGA